MKLLNVYLHELKEYENNPRYNDRAVDAVANSIRDFGFRVPIVIDRGFVIVAGHTRYKAARKLGLEAVPCLVADDLNEEQVTAFRLVDNKTAELAGWDFKLLDEELAALRGCGLCMEDYGFEDSEEIDIDDLFKEKQEKEKEPKRVQCEHCGEWFEI